MKSKMKLSIKKSFRLILLPLFFIAILALGASRANAAGGIYINESTFPDAEFRKYIINNFEVTRDGNNYFISNDTLQSVTEINVNGNSKLTSLSGIERFTKLKKLNCMQTNLSSLDVSNNKYLEELVCSNCPNLKQLNLTNNTYLKKLWCQANGITQLTITKNAKLEELNCRGNKLTSLNVTGNPALKRLECHNNKLTALNLANNKKLTYLSCYGNDIKTLDLTANTALQSLYCNDNPNLYSIDITKCTALNYVDCSKCNLSSINFDENVKLIGVYCQNNKLTSVSLNNSRDLKELYCYANNLQVIQLDSEGKMKELYAKVTIRKQSDNTDKLCYGDQTDPFIWKDRGARIAWISNNRIQPTNPTVNKEAISSFVAGFYYDVLERKTIDPTELNNWTENLAAHKVTSAEIARGFFLGDEFKLKNFSEDIFVEKLYIALLGRNSDASGKQSHLNALKGGVSREQIIAGFANSPEFKARCSALGILYGEFKVGSNAPANTRHFVIDSTNVNDSALDAYVERLYVQVLGRGSDPAGKENWKNGIKAGTNYDAVTVARTGFFGSAEYLNKHTSDEQFITDAYHAFLGREPDADGFANWKRQLQVNKMSRDFMLDVGFGTSEEFKNLLESYGFRVTVVN